MRARVGIAVAVILAMTSACSPDRITIPHPTPTATTPATTPTPVVSLPTAPPTVIAGPSCDGTAAATTYANFAAAFNSRQFGPAAALFGGDPYTAWWDPTDEPAAGQRLVDLPSHFAVLSQLGVRFPPAIQPRRGAELPGLGSFLFDDHHGFFGEGAIVCQTGMLTQVVVEGWPRSVAGRARITPPSSLRQNGSLGPTLN